MLAAASAHGDTKVPTTLITLIAFTALTALTIFPMRGAKQALNMDGKESRPHATLSYFCARAIGAIAQ